MSRLILQVCPLIVQFYGRYYLAEKKREAKASMEIVGRLRQQSQTTGRGGLLNDDLLKVLGLHIYTGMSK